MSLDGFIAGPDDDMQWVFGIDDGGGGTGEEVVRSIGALLVGRRTQAVEDQNEPGFYGAGTRGRSSCCVTIRRASRPSSRA